MVSFFDLNIRILKVSGLWIPAPDAPCRLQILAFNFACVFYSMVFFTLAEFAAIPESSANINDLVKNLNMSMSFVLTFFKVTVWFCNRKKIIQIMNLLQSTSTLFEATGDFNPAKIIRHEKIVKDRLTYTFFILAFTVPTSACLLTFFTVFTSESNLMKLPYHSFVPFNYKSSKFSYCLAVVYQCLALLSCGTITVGFDMLYTSLISFTGAHLKVLQGAFTTIRGRCERRKPKNLYKAMDDEMGNCVRHLQTIVGICDDLERIFTYLILLQILISLIVFCTCLYLVSTISLGSKSFGNEIVYMLAIENQLALYCYAGNKLTSRGEGIPFAIYEGEWFSASKKFKRNMIITMMRMGKPIHLTAGKFTQLTLNTFVTIGRGSYSLLAVLKNS